MNTSVFLLLSIITLQNPIKVNDSSPLPWFKGEEPSTPKNTVLVFVHGKHDDETIWFGDVSHYGHNDMYELAYNAGYRTAFVRLGGESSMWYNGRVLAQQIENIEHYFNTRNIVIIAHSKGGVDAQAALVYYNALGAPRKIISLATPYYGSPLADLVFSNVYTTWLALIIGQATPATFVLQTAYMYRFQQRISQDEDNQYVYYYTLSGWDHGPFPLWLGGAYLALNGGDNEHGGNDGAVTFQSAHVNFPNGHTYRVSLGANEDTEKKWYFNHFNIRLGQNTWQYIDSLLELYPVRGLPVASVITNTYNRPITIRSTGYILNGDGTDEFEVKPKTRLTIIKTKNASISLSKKKIPFKQSRISPDIEFASVITHGKEKISTEGKFFIIADEGKDFVSVTYNPVIKNGIPYIILNSEKGQDIAYNMFIKQYDLNGNFIKNIQLTGKVNSGNTLDLPLYEDALYNIHLKAYSNNSQRDIVFTMIKETVKSSDSTLHHPQLTKIERVEKVNFNTNTMFDILGRKSHMKRSGIFFNYRRRNKKTIILLE